MKDKKHPKPTITDNHYFDWQSKTIFVNDTGYDVSYHLTAVQTGSNCDKCGKNDPLTEMEFVDFVYSEITDSTGAVVDQKTKLFEVICRALASSICKTTCGECGKIEMAVYERTIREIDHRPSIIISYHEAGVTHLI